ncbi:ABC transporter permease [Methanosphaera sp. BMS]|uniref:ABC transporter permease n=1 Tax=Methanosphaera sp. BMS TaxID=1789762 RepID=UPI000DC1C5A2|nr:ABC transporter permease [Methanosphaera sp. BMS]AWX31962.1 ABC transporter permease [Methanosphaera sp. BMS]
MNYFKLILKNPFRNKTRSLLAIIGIAIGIATIVALGLITASLEDSTETTLKDGSAEITATKIGSSLSSSSGNLNESYVEELSKIDGVEKTAGMLESNVIDTSKNSDSSRYGFSLYGAKKDDLSIVGISNVNGSIFNEDENELIVGKNLADEENYTIGDKIDVYGNEFKITGIYETGSIFYDSAMYTSLSKLQNLTDNEDKISSISIKIKKDANLTTVNDKIKNEYNDTLNTITTEEMAQTIDDTLDMINSATTAIEALAIIIGGLGVINTMMMTVFERTREIGVLKSVGWTKKRILAMIMGESIVLTIISGIIGSILGVLAVFILFKVNGDNMTLIFNINIFIKAFIVALSVGIIGGLYPAIKASRLSPTEALRYE